MHGYCMFMAAALHHAYGFPVGVLTVTHDGVERLSHAWVVLPSGRHLDIQGEQSLKQVTQFRLDAPEANWKVYCPTTLTHLEQLAGTPLPPDEPDVIAALDVAQLYLEAVT